MKDTGRAEYGSDVIVDILKALGIEYVAINPGATFREIHDSIVNYGGNKNPEIILCLHEEIAVAMAHGYNIAASKRMAAIVHNLVGLLHATNAIYNVWVDQSPLMILGATGPVATENRRPWIDWIHTSMSQGNVVKDYVKWEGLAVSIPSAIDAILRGYQLSETEPKGPVYVCFDAAVQKEKLEEPITIPDVSRFAPPSPVQADREALKKAAGFLAEAKHPLVIADYLGTKPGAVNALVELAELLSLPVIDNGNMLSFPSTHPLDLTGAESELLSEADVILSLDVFDLDRSLTVDPFHDAPKHPVTNNTTVIDISLRHFRVKSWAEDYGKLQAVDLSISADTSVAIPALVSQCREIVSKRPELATKLQERFNRLKARHDSLRNDWKEQASLASDIISPMYLAAELWETVKNEDWVLINNARGKWFRQVWDISQPYQYIAGQMGGGLGHGIGRALGVALAHKPYNRICINTQPDGDFLYTPSGLWTAAHSDIPLLTVMYNNRTYYNSQHHQELVARQRGRPVENCGIGTRIDSPPVDYAGLARSFGVYGDGPVIKPGDLRPALERALAYIKEKGQPALVDVLM